LFAGFFCFLWIPAVVAAWAICRWVLGPFTEAMRMLRAPTRFFLSDFIWLLVMLQASFAVARLVLDQRGSFLVILTFLVVASIAIWAGAVSVLSRAGVYQTVRRGVFTLVLLPAVLLLLGATLCGPALVVVLTQTLITSRPPGDDFESVIWFVIVLAGIPVIIATAWALRRLTRWIVAVAPPSDVAGIPRKDEAKQ